MKLQHQFSVVGLRIDLDNRKQSTILVPLTGAGTIFKWKYGFKGTRCKTGLG
jgi:hypothetical protein